jgi:hypothetical protein
MNAASHMKDLFLSNFDDCDPLGTISRSRRVKKLPSAWISPEFKKTLIKGTELKTS